MYFFGNVTIHIKIWLMQYKMLSEFWIHTI